MDYKRAEEMVRVLTQDGGILAYDPEQVRLLLRVLKALAGGRPVTGPEIDAIAADLGWAPEAAHAFLRPLTERDAADAVIGVLPGLSLGDHPHSFWVNGRRMSAWCAEDMLFLPALLGQTGTIESTSPLSREPVRLTVGPDGVRSVNPPRGRGLDPDRGPRRHHPGVRRGDMEGVLPAHSLLRHEGGGGAVGRRAWRYRHPHAGRGLSARTPADEPLPCSGRLRVGTRARTTMDKGGQGPWAHQR